MKTQAPSSKLQRTSKLEIPTATAAWPLPGLLELGIWTFYGAWSLGFGASAQSLYDMASQD